LRTISRYGKNSEHRDLFPGALEIMILQSLRFKPMHGYALVKHIKEVSDNLLQVEEGSLYPALQRMLREGWLESEIGVSSKGRPPAFTGSRKRACATWRGSREYERMFYRHHTCIGCRQGLGDSTCRMSTGSSTGYSGAAGATTIFPSRYRSHCRENRRADRRGNAAHPGRANGAARIWHVALIQQYGREEWQWPVLESILADFKLTVRRLRKSPGFAATVLLTLAIGIARQHGGVQRGEQRAAEAAAVSGFRPAGVAVAGRAGRKRTGQL